MKTTFLMEGEYCEFINMLRYDEINKKTLFFLIVCLMVLISIIERFIFSMQPDTSMQLSVLEATLRGMVLGVDVLEVSTPMALSIFFPGIFIGQSLGISAETGTYITCYLVFFASFYLVYSFDKKAYLLNNQERFYFYLSYIFIFIVYFQDSFAQREHFAVMLMIPYLVLQASYSAKKVKISILEKFFSGIMMGLACAIKPYFIFVLICSALYNLYRTKSILSLFRVENIFLTLAYISYSLWCYWQYPEYFIFMKDNLIEYYVNDSLDLTVLFRQSHSVSYFYMLSVMLVIDYKLVRQKWSPLYFTLFLSSIAFYCVYALQRRGFAYHLYPAFSFLFLCFISVSYRGYLALRGKNMNIKEIRLYGLGIAFFAIFCLTEGFSSLRITPSTSRIEKVVSDLVPQPTMLTLNRDLADGHPLVRNIGGRWVGTYPSIWGYVNVLPQNYSLFAKENYDDLPPPERERMALRRKASLGQLATMVRDIKERKPDIILLSRDIYWREFILSQSDVVEALTDYKSMDFVDANEIWKRKTLSK